MGDGSLADGEGGDGVLGVELLVQDRQADESLDDVGVGEAPSALEILAVFRDMEMEGPVSQPLLGDVGDGDDALQEVEEEEDALQGGAAFFFAFVSSWKRRCGRV